MDRIPRRSEDVEIFCDGAAYGIFQFESSGCATSCGRTRRDSRDLIALNALTDTGPGEAHGHDSRPQTGSRVKVTYEVKELEPTGDT